MQSKKKPCKMDFDRVSRLGEPVPSEHAHYENTVVRVADVELKMLAKLTDLGRKGDDPRGSNSILGWGAVHPARTPDGHRMSNAPLKAGSICEACGAADKKMVRDHCHYTKENNYRGTLCNSCSQLCRRGSERIDLEFIARYLQRFYGKRWRGYMGRRA